MGVWIDCAFNEWSVLLLALNHNSYTSLDSLGWCERWSLLQAEGVDPGVFCRLLDSARRLFHCKLPAYPPPPPPPIHTFFFGILVKYLFWGEDLFYSHFESTTNCQNGGIIVGWIKHNQKGKSFALLDTAGRPNLIIPKEFARWLVAQPDHILDPRKVFDSKFAIRYLIPHIRKEVDAGMVLAIRRDLTRNLGRTQKASFETIRANVDQLMGGLITNYDNGDHSYTQLNLIEVIDSVIMTVSNQMLVGDELFHNKAFMKSLASFGNILGLASLLIGQFVPFYFIPVIGFLAGVVVKAYRRRALKFMVPVAQERIDRIRRKREDPGREYEEPMDIMQWAILACPDASTDEIAAALLSAVGLFFLYLSHLVQLQRGVSLYFFSFFLFNTIRTHLQSCFVQLPILNKFSEVLFSLSPELFSPFLAKWKTKKEKEKQLSYHRNKLWYHRLYHPHYQT